MAAIGDLDYNFAHPERKFWKLQPAEQIRVRLDESRHTKWGYIFYRCTYADDDAWNRFTKIVRERANYRISVDDGVDISGNLELTFREDRSLFDHATIDQIRQHWRAWIDVRKEPQDLRAITEDQGDQARTYITPRYMFFIHVDAKSLHSVVNKAPLPPTIDKKGVGYVNLVDSLWQWEYLSRDFENEDCETEDQNKGNHEDKHEDEDLDEVGDGEWNGHEDEGYMRVCLDTLHPFIYNFLRDRSGYYVAYRSPPEVWVY